MTVKTYILTPDDRGNLCPSHYYYGNILRISEESNCRYYMTVEKSGTIRVHANNPYEGVSIKSLKVRCPKCSSQMLPGLSSFNSSKSFVFRCIFC